VKSSCRADACETDACKKDACSFYACVSSACVNEAYVLDAREARTRLTDAQQHECTPVTTACVTAMRA